MKLNLLPTYVKQSTTRRNVGLFVTTLFIVINAVMLVWYISTSNTLTERKDTKMRMDQEITRIAAISDSADKILEDAKLLIAQTLAVDSVVGFNRRYPDAYMDIVPFIPAGVRVNRMNFTASGGDANANSNPSLGATAAPTTGTGSVLVMEVNIKDLKQLTQLLASLYQCPHINLVGIDEIKGPGTRYPSGVSGGYGPGAGNSSGSPTAGAPSAGAFGGGLSSGGMSSGTSVEPLLPGYNTYVITCVTDEIFDKPDVMGIIKGGSSATVTSSGTPANTSMSGSSPMGR